MPLIFVFKLNFFSIDDKDDKQDIRILNELENIDDDLEKEEIVIVRIDNDAEAKEYGIDHLPTLVYFENKIPALYEGNFNHINLYIEGLIFYRKDDNRFYSVNFQIV